MARPMDALVSICIPTYRRPELLREALESCLAQTYPAIEVVICDDSPDAQSEAVARSIGKPAVLRYYRNRPALGQAENVNRLFDLAQGDRLLLLHDDDLLLPRAVEQLADCWRQEPGLAVAYGKQYVMTMDGQIQERESERLNTAYYRAARYAGRPPSALWAGLLGQMPNNGYLIRAEAARSVRYRAIPEVGDACDFDFGLRVAQQYDGFFYLDEYLHKYRQTEVSVLRGNNYQHLTYALIEALRLPPELEPVRSERLRAKASGAINKWLTLGEKHHARRIYSSQYYPWSQRLSPRGLMQALLLSCPTGLTVSGLRMIRRLRAAR